MKYMGVAGRLAGAIAKDHHAHEHGAEPLAGLYAKRCRGLTSYGRRIALRRRSSALDPVLPALSTHRLSRIPAVSTWSGTVLAGKASESSWLQAVLAHHIALLRKCPRPTSHSNGPSSRFEQSNPWIMSDDDWHAALNFNAPRPRKAAGKPVQLCCGGEFANCCSHAPSASNCLSHQHPHRRRFPGPIAIVLAPAVENRDLLIQSAESLRLNDANKLPADASCCGSFRTHRFGFWVAESASRSVSRSNVT